MERRLGARARKASVMIYTLIRYEDCKAFLCRRGHIQGNIAFFRPRPAHPPIAEIQRRVADHYRVRLAEMTSARRSREVARPRQIAMYLSRQLTPRSLPEIGRRFGGRDHTTVIHAIRQIEKLRAGDNELDRDIMQLEAELAA